MKQIQVQYTFEEFCEAVAAHQAQLLAGKGKNRWIRRAIGAGIMAICAMIWILIASSSGMDVTKFRVIVASMGPMIPWVGLLSISTGIQMASGRGLYAIRIFLLSLLTIAVVAAAISYALQPDQPQKYGESSNSIIMIYSWFFFLAMWFRLFMMYVGKRPYLKLWNGQSSLHVPKEIEFGENGVTINDALTATSYRWPAFARARETENIVLLYLSEFQFHMIPKRCLSGPGELEELRALIEHHINGRTRGFPVLQVQPVSPAGS